MREKEGKKGKIELDTHPHSNKKKVSIHQLLYEIFKKKNESILDCKVFLSFTSPDSVN